MNLNAPMWQLFMNEVFPIGLIFLFLCYLSFSLDVLLVQRKKVRAKAALEERLNEHK